MVKPIFIAKGLGEERFAVLFSPLGVLSELIGQGNLTEAQATRVAQQAVAKVREKILVTKKEGNGSSPTDDKLGDDSRNDHVSMYRL